LQKTIDDKAPAADVKAALVKVQAEHKAKQAAYDAAQDDLRKLLTARQEAIMTMAGILR